MYKYGEGMEPCLGMDLVWREIPWAILNMVEIKGLKSVKISTKINAFFGSIQKNLTVLTFIKFLDFMIQEQ